MVAGIGFEPMTFRL